MLTIIPKDKFKELINTNIVEDQSVSIFDLDDFKSFIKQTQYSKNAGGLDLYFDIMDYMKQHNVKYISQGSSRIAYFMPSGSLKDRSIPCCLKVAKSPAGYAQTKAEIELFKKYDGLECFPKMFDYSPDGKYIITEFGEKIDDNYINTYMHFWNRVVRNNIDDSSNCIFTNEYTGARAVVELIRQFNNCYSTRFEGYLEDTYDDLYNNIIQPIAEKYHKYVSLRDMIKLSKNNELLNFTLADLCADDNWGLVCRENTLIPMPIDWGLTNDVAEKYY